jgi:hypothetical protein
MSEVKKITLQVRAPKGQFPGEIVQGYYCLVEGCLVMTDADGKPIDNEKHQLAPGQDAHLLACRLVRRRRTGPRGFSDKLIYPKLKY